MPFDSIKLKNDPDGIHFGLYANDYLTTVASVFHDGDVYQFRKLATLLEAQGKGYGSAMIAYIIDSVKVLKAKSLWCNARVSVAPFYSKFGFVEKGNHFTENNIDFVIMELELGGTLVG